MAVTIACCYGAIVLALRPYLIEGYTPNTQVAAAAMPLVLIVVCYHLFDALQITTAFVLRAYKVAVVPTVIYAVALWGVGLAAGICSASMCWAVRPSGLRARAASGSRISSSLAIAGIGLLLYWRTVSQRYLRADVVVRADSAV